MVHLYKIKTLCEKRKVSIKQVAAELGMTEQSLHKIVKTNSTKIDTLIAISDYFKVSPAYFFDTIDEQGTNKVLIDKNELDGLLKKIIAYSIHGFGMVKLEWDTDAEKFNTYFDLLKKQFSPDERDLNFISSLIDTPVEITETTTPKDVTKLLMTKDEFDFTSAYYYGMRKMEAQEEYQNYKNFLNRHNIQPTDKMKLELEELESKIKHYESMSIIGNIK